MKVYLSLGSNLGCAHRHFRYALKELATKTGRVCGMSRVYRSPAMYVKNQEMFSNLVVLLDTTLTPLALLRELECMEKATGRVRKMDKGPRTLDMDIIFYALRHIQHPQLCIPHPFWRERSFVVLPLLEVMQRHEAWKLKYFGVKQSQKTLSRYGLCTTRPHRISARYQRWTAWKGYGKRKCCCGNKRDFCP